MNESAEVLLWGKKIGVVSKRDGEPFVRFAYDGEFRDSGLEPSPVTMPVLETLYTFPDLPYRSFHGLPGLLSDSVPDKFGNAVIDVWLRSQNRSVDSLTPIERLCYTGSRGMGALEYRPTLFKEGDTVEAIRVEALARLADDVLRLRQDASAELVPDMKKFASILRVGSSAGGARAKALIGFDERTGEVRSGQVKLPPNFGYWLIKFDGVDGNGDKEDNDKWGYGHVEYSYYLMARAAGIEMTECRLWDKRHFMTRRFDRLPGGGKLHMQTLGALAHMDFNDPLSYSYEQAFDVTRQVVRDVRAEEQLFRRMVFNVLAWNCDDHVKNIAYLMDRDGEWSLAPAYDECFAHNPSGDWTSRHQMSVNGKRIGITDDDLMAASRIAGIKEKKARAAIDEVRATVARWPEFAETAEVGGDFIDAISRSLR